MHFEHGQLCLHVQELLCFGVSVVVLPFQITTKIGFLRILKTRFSAFWAQKCRVVLCPTTHKDIKNVFQSFFTLFSFPFLSLTFFLSVFPLFPSFIPSFLPLSSFFPYFLLLLLFAQEHPNIHHKKNLLFPVFVWPFFVSLSFSDFRSFFLSFCLSFLFLPSFVSLPSFLLFSSFFHSFLLYFPSFASKEKEEREAAYFVWYCTAIS